MSDPLALLPIAIAAGGGRLDPFHASQLAAAGITLLQRSAPLVRALAGRRSAILLPSGPQFLVALAASDGRGALMLDSRAPADHVTRQLAQEDVGVVFTLERLMPLLPAGTPLVLLDNAPRMARVVVPGRTNDVDLGSHHGLSLVGDTATDGRDEECLVTYSALGMRQSHSHRELIASARAAVADLLFTPVDHVLSVLPCSDPEALVVGLAAPLMAGAQLSMLTPLHTTDVLDAAQRDEVSMIAGRWRTEAGIRVTAFGVTTALQRLRDGDLLLDAW